MTFDALPTATTFPGNALDVRAEINLSGTWTDITSYVLTDPVTIGRGHPDESTTTAPSTLTMTLADNDGRFAATNPTGPYYGSLIRNTPVRVSVPEGASYMRLENDGANAATSYASCPDSVGVSITGDMDVQLDVTLDNWNGAQILAGKWAETGNERTWLLLLNDTGSMTLIVSGNGTNTATAASVVPLPRPPLLRQCIRVTWSNASSTANFYTAPAGNLASASWTLADTVVTSGVTTLFDSTAAVQVGYVTDAATATSSAGVLGKVHAFRLLAGIAGTEKAAPDFTAQTAGTTSFTDAESNTWTLAGTSEISNRKYRCHMEVPAWPQAWAPTNTNVTVGLSGAGLLQRLGRAQRPVPSAMRRAVLQLSNLRAYWPMEDQANSTQIASGLTSGGNPMFVQQGTLTFAGSSAFACSQPLPVLNGAELNGVVGTYTSSGSIVVRCLWNTPSADTLNGTIFSVYTTGTFSWGVQYAGGFILAGQLAPGSGVGIVNATSSFAVADGQLWLLSLEITPSGSNVKYTLAALQAGSSTPVSNSVTTGSAASVGVCTRVLPNSVLVSASLTKGTIGHLYVQDTLVALSSMANPLQAWAGETAGNRFSRLCGENGIPFRGRGRLAATPQMGTQTSETLTSLLQECTDAGHAIWTEPRQVLGWGYRTAGDVGSQTPAVTYDYALNHIDWPLGETEDDQIINNDVTVTNTTGSSARAVQTTGPLSTASPTASPPGVGTYDTNISLNLHSDSQLTDQAGFNLGFGTVAEPRYPAINVDLANTDLSSSYYATLDADLGDRVQILHPPVWLPPNTIDQIINGATETLFTKTLTEAWAGIPATPWNVAVAGSTTYGHAETDGSTLASGATNSATSLSVATTNGAPSPLWTTSAGDFPFDIVIAGERMTVTNITGASSPQTFTVTRSVNGVVKAQSSGAAVALFTKPIAALV